jgi:hypothetical protein
MPARPESLLARAERKRGISVPALLCPALVVYDGDFSSERGTALAELYGCPALGFPGLDHWDLVLNPAVRRALARFLGVGTRPQVPRERGVRLPE